MQSRPRLLLAEDDRDLRVLLTRLLDAEGYAVTAVGDGQRALHLGLVSQFDVALLDRGLPVMDGLDLVAALRQRGFVTPVLILSARGTAADRVEGLDAGAEDYLTKPFDVAELLARLRALLRRHGEQARTVSVGTARLDLDTRVVTGPDLGEPGVTLSAREADLLAALAARPGRVFTRDELLHRVFVDATSEVVVDTYVHYLRRKLGAGSVVTVRGVGYRVGRW